MAFVAVTYEIGVLEGKAAGVRIAQEQLTDSSGRAVAEAALATISPKEMAKRIEGLMAKTERMLKVYVKLQFETSGRAMGAIASQIGAPGGSESPWHALDIRTLQARARGHGYYGYTKGKTEFSKTQAKEVGESSDAGWGMDPAEAMEMKETAAREGIGAAADVKPRLWTKRGMKICNDGILKGPKSVNVRITEMTVRFNEPTRPVFVISEIFRLTEALAKLGFKNLRTKYNRETDAFTKETPVDPTTQPFSFKVGEKRPFEKDKVGRPRSGLGQPSRLLRGKAGTEMSKEAKAVRLREGIKQRLTKRKKFIDDILAGRLMSEGD